MPRDRNQTQVPTPLEEAAARNTAQPPTPEAPPVEQPTTNGQPSGGQLTTTTATKKKARFADPVLVLADRIDRLLETVDSERAAWVFAYLKFKYGKLPTNPT